MIRLREFRIESHCPTCAIVRGLLIILAASLCLAAPAQTRQLPGVRSSSHRGTSTRPIIVRTEPPAWESYLEHRGETLSGIRPDIRTLTVSGRHFRRGAKICVDGRPVATTWFSSTRLRADRDSILFGRFTTNGNRTELRITVVNPGKRGRRSNAVTVNWWGSFEAG